VHEHFSLRFVVFPNSHFLKRRDAAH
jgi:hypothetical protein